MPFANYDGIPRQGELSDAELPVMALDRCPLCGAIPSEQDARAVAQYVHCLRDPCCYCGESIKVRSIKLKHGTRLPCDRWFYESFDRESTLDWGAHEGKDHSFRMFSFQGHLSCALKAMPYLKPL
jgi:hypothetical protein